MIQIFTSALHSCNKLPAIWRKLEYMVDSVSEPAYVGILSCLAPAAVVENKDSALISSNVNSR